MRPQAKIIPGVNCNVIRDELMQNGNVAGATQDWCTHDKLGDCRHLGEFGVAGKVTSTQGCPETGTNGAIPGVFMLAQPPFLP